MLIRCRSGRSYSTTDKEWTYRAAAVKAAVEKRSQTPVCILTPPGLEEMDADWHKGFLTEAKAIAAVSHRSLNRLVDAGRDEDGRPCVVCQHQEGVSINRIISARRSPMEELLTLLVVRSVAQCVESLHDAGIVHGHIAPSCIRLLGKQQIHLSYTIPACLRPALIGEESGAWRLFRAPEAGEPDTHHDIYALGMVALACLRPALLLGGMDEAVERLRTEGPAEALAGQTQISDGCRQCIACACAIDPRHRYKTIGDLVADATDIIAGQQARHAKQRREDVDRDENDDDENRRSNFFNTADIQAHLAKERDEQAEKKSAKESRDSAMMEVLDKKMLEVIAKLVVVSPDSLHAYINLAPGTAFPRNLLEAVLDKANVCFGRNEINIVKATRPSDAMRRLEIARGICPKPGVPGTNVHGGETLPLMQDASIEIRADGMEAWLLSVPGEAVSPTRVREVAREAGIAVELLPEALASLDEAGEPEGACLIARGEPPFHGVPSQFIPSRRDILDQQTIDEFIMQGSAGHDRRSLQEQNGVRMVRRGECLAVWRQGTHPRDGYDVRGQTVKALEATSSSAAACAGEGTELHRNKSNLIFLRARRGGAMQMLDDGTVRVVGVSETSAHELESGQAIESEDLLIINGDVPDGAVIHANGGLIVHGSVGDASLQIGGDCVIDEDLRPGSAELQCAGEMRCGNITGRSVIANSLEVTGCIRDCDVTVLGDCRAGKAGGGKIVAAGNIIIGELGDEDGTTTECWAGHHVPKAVQRSMAKLDEKRLRNERRHMLQEREEMREMVENIARTQYRFNVGGWMGKEYLSQMKDRIERIKLRGTCIDDSLERARHLIVDKVDEIDEIQEDADNTRAFVRADKVHTRVIVKLADSETRTFEHGQDDLDYRMH